MRYEDFKTAEEYLNWLFLSNRGTQNFIKKDDLKKIAESHKISFDDNETKENLLKLVLEYTTYQDLAREFKAGVSSYEYQHKFNISGEEVKRMERLGFITVTGSQRFHAYGRYRYANLYDVFEFYSLTRDTVREFLNRNPKGTRKNKKG